MSKPLSGIKVVELASFVAAPVVGRLLSDLGAEVIKIEPANGDGWRLNGMGYLPQFSKEENPIFDIYNTGKKFISLNLKVPEGKDALFALLEETDIFITNTRPAALRRLGLHYDDLKARFPRLIYALVLGYGEKGPDKDTPAFDTTAFWSRGGFLRDLAPNSSDYYPINPPSGVGDTVTGYLLLAEITTALYNRTTTGKGDFVRSTLYHNAVFCFGTMQIQTQKPFGKVYPKARHELGAPGGNYQCSDGEWIICITIDETAVKKACRILGLNQLLDDPGFAPDKRWSNMHIYYPMFREAFLSRPSDYWLRVAAENDLTVMRMCHFSEISEDPQAWANDYLERVRFPNGNVDIMPASPIEMDSCIPPKTVPSPWIGADTATVLAQLGYNEEQIEAMIACGAAIAAEKS